MWTELICWSHPARAGLGLEGVPCFFEAVPALPQDEEENCLLYLGKGVGSALGRAAFLVTDTAEHVLGQMG